MPDLLQICISCTKLKLACPFDHIDAYAQVTNVTHPGNNICYDCLLRISAEDKPCPICRGEFNLPDEPTPTECNYRLTRKSKKCPNGQCPKPAIRFAPDRNAYCVDHIDLGHMEMQLRAETEETAKKESISNKKRRLAQQFYQQKLRKIQADSLEEASNVYFSGLSRGADVISQGSVHILNAVRNLPPTLGGAPTQQQQPMQQ